MRLDWPPLRQGPPLQLVAQVQEKNWPGHRQNENFKTFGKKGEERIQRGHQGQPIPEEEEQVWLNHLLRLDNSADETTRMSTRKESGARMSAVARGKQAHRTGNAPF